MEREQQRNYTHHQKSDMVYTHRHTHLGKEVRERLYRSLTSNSLSLSGGPAEFTLWCCGKHPKKGVSQTSTGTALLGTAEPYREWFHSAELTVRAILPAVLDLYTGRCRARARSVMKDA